MDFDSVFALIKSRRSVRRFEDRLPSRAEIERVVEAACWAPSNHNRQGWKFLVFTDRQEIRRLAGAVRQTLRERLAEVEGVVAAQAEKIIHYGGAFDAAPVVILAMHKKSPAAGRTLLAGATGEVASGEVLSTAMAVENLLLAARAAGLGACVMTAPLLAGEVWKGLPDLPAGFLPTCLVALGYPAEQPDPPRRKKLQHVIEYR